MIFHFTTSVKRSWFQGVVSKLIFFRNNSGLNYSRPCFHELVVQYMGIIHVLNMRNFGQRLDFHIGSDNSSIYAL